MKQITVINNIQAAVTGAENNLRMLRDNVDSEGQRTINEALRLFLPMLDALREVERAIEVEFETH